MICRHKSVDREVLRFRQQRKKKIIDTKDEGYKEATVERMGEVFFYRAQCNEFILL